jgi:hypothetical protein
MQPLRAKHSFIVRVIDGASNPLHRAAHAEQHPQTNSGEVEVPNDQH